jgi:hypothetical protein
VLTSGDGVYILDLRWVGSGGLFRRVEAGPGRLEGYLVVGFCWGFYLGILSGTGIEETNPSG